MPYQHPMAADVVGSVGASTGVGTEVVGCVGAQVSGVGANVSVGWAVNVVGAAVVGARVGAKVGGGEGGTSRPRIPHETRLPSLACTRKTCPSYAVSSVHTQSTKVASPVALVER